MIDSPAEPPPAVPSVDPLSFSPSPPPPDSWSAEEEDDGRRAYMPIVETLRHYAGWCLAWYAIVYAVGSYQFTRETPVRIPYAESLFLSPLLFSFTLATFLFLLLEKIHKILGGGTLLGFAICLFGIAIFAVYRVNIV